VSRGGGTAPGDGGSGDAAAPRGWQRGHSRRLRQSGRGGGTPTRVVASQTGGYALCLQGTVALLHGIVCIVASWPFLTFLWINFLRCHAPRLFVALAPSLMRWCQMSRTGEGGTHESEVECRMQCLGGLTLY